MSDRKPITPERVVKALAKDPALFAGVKTLLGPPTTLGGVVFDMLIGHTEGELADFAAASWDDINRFHHSLGQHIRNRYMLWDEANRPLLEELCRGRSEVHPDEASTAVMEALWRQLQDTVGD